MGGGGGGEEGKGMGMHNEALTTYVWEATDMTIICSFKPKHFITIDTNANCTVKYQKKHKFCVFFNIQYCHCSFKIILIFNRKMKERNLT